MKVQDQSYSIARHRMRPGDNSTPLKTRFGMNRRDVMKLASLAMLPMTPGAVMASSQSEPSSLKYKVFTVTRPGLNRRCAARRGVPVVGRQFGDSDLWRAGRGAGGYLPHRGAIQRLGRRHCCERKDAEGNLCHSCPWRSFLRDKSSAGSISGRESTGHTRGSRQNEAADHAGEIEWPMALASPKSNSGCHFDRRSVARR